jgi:hypothetical protein
MFRVDIDGQLSDMANLSRAKDAAATLASANTRAKSELEQAS